MSFTQLMLHPSLFTLLLAPPGWGKTSLLLDIYARSAIKIIYISPLRALADEFYQRICHQEGIFSLKHFKDQEKKLAEFTGSVKGMIITTPELLDENFIDRLAHCNSNLSVVLDEFHLFYYWGESFRPRMWDITMHIANSGCGILGMTATMDSSLLAKWKVDFYNACNEIVLVDLGNQTLKTSPNNHYCYPGLLKKVFINRFLYELHGSGQNVLLYFCRYRDEVRRWQNYCDEYGISAISCVGGEVELFQKGLKQNPRPKCIFATTVLSHGVNLPSCTGIYIAYRVPDIDFFIQMVGRGGRNGEAYDVHSFFSNGLGVNKKLRNILDWLKLLFVDLVFIRPYLYFKDI